MATKKKASAKRKPKNPKAPPEAQNPPGRPTKLTEALGAEICMRIMEGRSLKSICDDADMPCYRSVLTWVIIATRPEPPALHAEFLHRYTQAREMQQDALMDECLDIADDGRNDWVMRKGGMAVDNEAIARSRLRVDTRMVMAEKLAPKKYGKKIDLNHGGQTENPFTAVVKKASASPLIPPGAMAPE